MVFDKSEMNSMCNYDANNVKYIDDNPRETNRKLAFSSIRLLYNKKDKCIRTYHTHFLFAYYTKIF